MAGRRAQKKVDMSREHRKAEDSVMFFHTVYTPVFTVSLASKKNRPSCLLSSPPLPFGAVFSFISITCEAVSYQWMTPAATRVR